MHIPDTMLDFKKVRYFVAVAEGGSLTRTSAHLHIPRSILSREVQSFEQSLGRRLFNRTGRGMKVTEFGRQLLPRARALIEDASRFSDEAQNLRGRLSGTVTVGLPGSVFALVAAPLMKISQQRYPDLSLRFVEGRSAVLDGLLAAGDIDIGLAYTPKARIQKGEVPLGSSSLYVVGPPKDRLTASTSVTLATLAKHPLFLPSRPHVVRAMLEDAFSNAGYALRILCEVDSLLAQKELVSAGLGLTVCLHHAIAADVRARRFQAAPIRKPYLETDLVMKVAPKNVLTKASRAIAELMSGVCRELAARHGSDVTA